MQKNLSKGSTQILERSILWFILLLSIGLRISLYKVQTNDYVVFFGPWYDFVQTHGHFAAFKYQISNYIISNYHPPYLYLLILATYLPIQKIFAIKTISVCFDMVIALFTYLMLRLKYKHSYAPVIGALVTLFAPTIFMNSAAWGQFDAIYIACCLGSLYFLLCKRPVWACIFFGIAISFKLQAIFFLPVLILLLVTRKLPIKSLILIPVIYLALLTPAFFEGRDAWSLLTIYLREANDRYPHLALDAPTFYQWLPTGALQDWKWMGIMLATMMVALISFLALTSRKLITPDIILKLTLVFSLVIPFLLPEMHERYFYLADVISIIYAFYFPRYFYVALIEQLCSLMGYTFYLFHIRILSFSYVAFFVLFLIMVTLADLVKTLYPNIQTLATVPVTLNNDMLPNLPDNAVSPKVSSNVTSQNDVNPDTRT